MSVERIVVPALIGLGIAAGTVLPVTRALGQTGRSGLTFHQRRRDAGERAAGAFVGLAGAAHGLWGVLYAVLGPGPLGVRPAGPVLFAVGVAAYLVGVAVVVTAQRQMGRSWRIGLEHGRTELVEHGLYARVRNPIYLGDLLLGVAALAMTPALATLLGALGFYVAIRAQVGYEERHLLVQHGDAYRRYRGRAGRFLPSPSPRLSARERDLLGHVAAALLPAGRVLPAAGAAAVARVEELLAATPAASGILVRMTLRGVAAAARLATGRRFETLPRERAEELLARWLSRAPGLLRHPLRGLVAIIKSAHLESAEAGQALGARVYPAVTADPPAWLARVHAGARLAADEELDVDAVVVGSGAGGAVAAYELAARGHSVVLLEEGRYYGRADFAGRPAQGSRRMFRDGGLVFALGNVLAPVWAGVTVGGSTTVNSGTCYRTPERTLRRWRDELGLDMLSAEALEPRFARVERILGIEPTAAHLLGGGARALARGAERLGLRAAPIPRNAPGCDGQARCMFGCPTGAKRSTDVSYVPMAVEQGAALYTETRADELTVEGGRATGVVARCAGGARLRVRARVTVLAGGALMTPLLLLGNRLANASGMVGRNLSLHPAAPVLALFDEPIAMEAGVPQGFAVDHFADQGIMIEESGNPPEVVGLALPLVGARLVELLERYPHLSAFGYMICDRSRGRVRRGGDGSPRLSYWLDAADTRTMQRALEALCELYLAAGARAVFPAVRGFDELRDDGDLARLRAHRLAAGDFAVSAVHPLGTARLGLDRRTSVVGPDHQCHDVRDLYVVDGSAVPTALGINPQVTIMALATRAAELIHERL
jgi:choline dehydrogenase-like flavoprotein/protein-S-isoprenylcysteine O-methyltransferase Ste14